MSNKCYINAAEQVSCQLPLSEEWMQAPIISEEEYLRCIEPSVKEMISPGEARRMSAILKRAIVTSFTALKKSDIEVPEAIITGTGMGCMENSEKFLIDLANYGENCLKPSLFMQSTHNTISSLVAILLKCHGYNNTFSHKGISFDSALLDAWIQIKAGVITNALVGAHDETTPFMAKVLRKTHPEYGMITEASMSTLLTSERSDKNICELSGVEISHNSSIEDIALKLNAQDDKVLLLGVNGVEENDTPYRDLISRLEYNPLLLQYKNIFGNNFSISALGFYVAVKLIEMQKVPSFMYYGENERSENRLEGITLINHSENNNWSIIRLKLCGS